MIFVTDRARDTLRTLKEAGPEDRALRLEVSGSGAVGIVCGSERRGDYAVEHDGVTVLLVASALAARLAGARLDCEELASGRRLVLSAPRGRFMPRIGH